MTSILNRKTPITTKDEYHTLARKYHPDNGGSATEMAHINALYAEDYVPPNQIRLPNLIYNYTHHNPALNYYEGNSSILFQPPIPAPSPPVFAFADTKMEQEMSKYLPVYLRQHSEYIVIAKPQKVYPLAPNIDKIKGTPHASWIISSLYNLLCYLEYAGLTHNDLQVGNIWIDPVAHSAHLYGGWWWSAPVASRLTHLPVSSLPAPRDKLATHTLDLRLIKHLGLELMGDRTGMTLDKNEKTSFLRQPTSGSAITDYKAWIQSLGERKFVELKL